MLGEACRRVAELLRHRDLLIAINLSAVQVRRPGLAERVAGWLSAYGVPPSALELEVTENIVLDDDAQVLETLAGLRAIGVGIAFDDFGTGYASLSLLKKYPLTRLKIDRSFVKHVHDSDRDASVIRAIVDMTHSFGLETIAEGIENDRQCDRLYRMGCQEGQGYLFSQPLPALVFGDMFGIGGGALAMRA